MDVNTCPCSVLRLTLINVSKIAPMSIFYWCHKTKWFRSTITKSNFKYRHNKQDIDMTQSSGMVDHSRKADIEADMWDIKEQCRLSWNHYIGYDGDRIHGGKQDAYDSLHCSLISLFTTIYSIAIIAYIMISRHEKILRITGPLWRESTSNLWFPLTKGQ